MCVDGLGEGSVPVADDAVDLRLDQQLRPLSSLQLQRDNLEPPRLQKPSDVRGDWRVEVEPPWLCSTSMTCFLLDFSLEAHSTEPPRRSTVNSGFDWLLPNFWEQQAEIHSTQWQLQV